MEASSRSRALRHLRQNIDFTYADVHLLLLTFAGALVEGLTLREISVFIGNCTGNLTLIGLEAASATPSPLKARPTQSGTSLVAFATGAVVIGQLGHLAGQRRRAWLVINGIFVAMMTLAAAVLVQVGAVEMRRSEANKNVLFLIAMLSFAFGGQIASSRFYGVPQILIVAITMALTDLSVDKRIFALHNRPRDRRIAFILTLFAGSSLGGLAVRKHSPSAALFIAGGIQFLVALTWLITPADQSTKRPDDLVDAESAQPRGSAIERPSFTVDTRRSSLTLCGAPSRGDDMGVKGSFKERRSLGSLGPTEARGSPSQLAARSGSGS